MVGGVTITESVRGGDTEQRRLAAPATTE